MKAIRNLLILIIITFILLEAGLYTLDPLGLVTYLHSQEMIMEHTVPAHSGYAFTSGEHDAKNYTFTILDDGSRLVPDTNESDCTLAAIGDSLTFGMGVNDADTWVNNLAIAYPDVHFINAGRPAYSIGNITRLVDEFNADGYIYLIISNDAGGGIEYSDRVPNYQLASRLYWVYWALPYLERIGVEAPQEPVYDTYYSEFVHGIESLRQKPISMFSFGDALGHLAEANIIPSYTQSISAADYHPNAASHQEIAESMMTYIDHFIKSTCAE